jgi:hypothetical protein
MKKEIKSFCKSTSWNDDLLSHIVKVEPQNILVNEMRVRDSELKSKSFCSNVYIHGLTQLCCSSPNCFYVINDIGLQTSLM